MVMFDITSKMGLYVTKWVGSICGYPISFNIILSIYPSVLLTKRSATYSSAGDDITWLIMAATVNTDSFCM